MREIRLTVRCLENESHAKVLAVRTGALTNPEAVRTLLRVVGTVLDGTSQMYIHAPSEKSPIGFCGLCRGKVRCDLTELEVKA